MLAKPHVYIGIVYCGFEKKKINKGERRERANSYLKEDLRRAIYPSAD